MNTCIGVIGGTGLYRLFDDDQAVETISVETPYGPPSAGILLGSVGGRDVAFLPRHGDRHTVPPHRIPYRANVWALASLGVRAIVTSSAVGGLSERARPGSFLIPDQLIDRTRGRADTFYDTDLRGTNLDNADDVQHLAAADPFDPVLRSVAIGAMRSRGEEVEPEGTSVVIQGPRFSTRAESRWFRAAGADVVNMTQYPEAVLAAELNVGLVTLAFVTDTDAGTVGGDLSDVADAAVVVERMAQAEPRIRAAITAIVAAIPPDYRPRTLIPLPAVRRVLSLAGAGPARANTAIVP